MPEPIYNLLRLEIDASDALNQISNHSAQTDTTGWSSLFGTMSRVTGTYGTTGTAVQLVRTTGDRTTLFTPEVTVAPGQWTNMGVSVLSQITGSTVGAFYRASFVYGYGVNNVSFSEAVDFPLGTERISFQPRQAPALTTRVRAHIQLIAPNATGSTMQAWEAVTVISSSQALVEDTTFYSGARWQNMLGKSFSLKTTRGNELDGVVDTPQVGTLSAVMNDPMFDPTKNARVRPGRKVRVTYLNSGFWSTLWTGNLTTVDVNYSGSKPRVTLQATDTWAQVNNFKVPEAFNGSLTQRGNAVAAKTPGVDYTFYSDPSNDPNVSTPVVIDVQADATATDQLKWISITKNAFLMCQTNGRIQLQSFDTWSNGPSVYFSDRSADSGAVYYTDIDTNFGSQALFNEFMVERHNLDEEDGEKTYGPYTNAVSKSQWGSKSTTIDVNDGVPREIAERYAKVYANPEIFASQVKFNARQHMGTVAMWNLYGVAAVKHSASGLNANYRILNIEHEITPESWEVTVGFRPLEATAAVTITNPPGGASSGPGDLVQPTPGQHSRRYRNTTFSVAHNTSTTVPYNVVDTEDGITYDTANNRWVVSKDGRYVVSASVSYSPNATGARIIDINLNGSVKARGRIIGWTSTNNIVGAATVLKCAAGDVISVTTLHNQGAALALAANGAENFASVTFVGA